MRRILFIITLFACVARVSAQAELQRLLTTYTESVRLPYYKECKMYDDRIPKRVERVTLDGVMLTVVYVVHNGAVADMDLGEYNAYTAMIDLSKSTIAKINNTIEMVCEEGIEITEENGTTGKKYPFLIEKWSIKCNDLPLCNKIFDAMRDFGTLEVDDSVAENEFVDNDKVDGLWSVNGRTLKGKLVEPSYSGSEQGVVVIAIRVDASGKVVDAIKGSGTTIKSAKVIEAAMEAAKKNMFSSGSSPVSGTITYRFRQ